MESTLETIVKGVPACLEAAETEEDQKIAKRESDRAHKEARTFQSRIEGALGLEVLATLGSLTYGGGQDIHRMNFQMQDKSFELRQTIGSFVNLLAGKKEVLQFNLSNPQARDRFLEALKSALPITT